MEFRYARFHRLTTYRRKSAKESTLADEVELSDKQKGRRRPYGSSSYA